MCASYDDDKSDKTELEETKLQSSSSFDLKSFRQVTPSDFKELEFVKSLHNNETALKCAEFWRYLYSRSDLVPVRANLQKLSTSSNLIPTQNDHDITKTSISSENEPIVSSNPMPWFNTLKMFTDKNCEKAAFSASRECKECLKEGKERKKICIHAELEPDTRNQDLEDLNNWTPDPKGKNKNVY